MVKAVTKPAVKAAEEAYRNEKFPDVNKVVNKNMLCTSCNCSVKQLVVNCNPKSHPFLSTLLCEKCHKFFGDGDFSVDEDGSDKYCRWCGQGGTLYLCSKCTAGFCKKCIKRNLPRSALKDVEEEDWECLCCNVKPLYELRAICWAALQYADKNSKRKRKGGEKDSSDDEASEGKGKKRTRDSSDEETTKDSQRTPSKRIKKAKKKESSDDDEVTPTPRTPSRKSKRAKSESSDEDEKPSKKSSRKSTRNRNESKNSPGKSSGDEDESKSKLQEKELKLARTKMTTVLNDLIKLNNVSNNKANDLKKKKIAAKKINSFESFQTTAQSVSNFLLSVEEMTKKLRLTFTEFVTKFEETVAELNNPEENGIQAAENGDVAEGEVKMDTEESPSTEVKPAEEEDAKEQDSNDQPDKEDSVKDDVNESNENGKDDDEDNQQSTADSKTVDDDNVEKSSEPTMKSDADTPEVQDKPEPDDTEESATT